jgi:hypothetical protein
MVNPPKIADAAGGGPIASQGKAVGGLDVPEKYGPVAAPKRTPKKRSSKFNIKYGTAEVKAFPIYEGEMFELGSTGVLASIAFSGATYFVSLGVDLAQQLAFNETGKAEVLAFWQASRNWSFGLGALCAIVGLGLFAFGANKIRNILNRTTFEDE